MAGTASMPEGPTGDFTGDINVSSKLPSQRDLERVADLPVLDSNGEPHPFKTLHSSPNGPQRVLIIFIRHFFCGVSPSHLSPIRKSLMAIEALTYIRTVKNTFELCHHPSLPSRFFSLRSQRRSSLSGVGNPVSFPSTSRRQHVPFQSTPTQPRTSMICWE